MWRLGPYRLDPTSFRLERDGEPVPLQRRPFDLLLYLVAERGRIVSRDELLREVWGGVTVAEGAVSTAVYELRSALGDLERRSSKRWVETVRGRGFRYRGPATEVASSEPPDDALPFVGRHSALAALNARFAAARDGRGSVLIVEGRAGMGKTRLVQEWAAALRPPGSTTVACEPGAPPLWPWSELLRLLPGAGYALVGTPAKGAKGKEVEEPLDPDALHFQRVETITRRLAHESQRTALVVVVEDLHWADPASLEVLTSLAPRLQTLPVLLIGTERSEVDAPASAPALAHHVDRIRLKPLVAAQIYPLVEAILGRVPSPELVGWLERHGQGVPLVVRELAENVAVNGESLVDVPRIAQRLFARRFESLRPENRIALGVAALCGLRFDAPLVEAAAGDALAADRAWIRDALHAGILVSDRDHPLRFAFRHATLRDAAEGGLEPSAVPEWHRRIADAIERRHPEPSGAVLSQLARHSTASAMVGSDAARPLRHALLAARRAARVLDWTEVALHAGHALDWTALLPSGRARDVQEIEAAQLLCAAIAGASGHVEKTAALLERIEPLLARVGDEEARATFEGFRFSNARCAGDYRRAHLSADRVAEIKGLEAVAACWQVVLASLAGDFETATADAAWGDEVPGPAFREYTLRCGRDPGIDRLGLSAFAFWARGQDGLALSCAERAVRWSQQTGDARGCIWAMFLLCLLHEMRRDWKALGRWSREIDRASARSGVSSWLGVGTGLRLWAEASDTVSVDAEVAPHLRPLAVILHDRGRSTSTSFTTPLLLLASRVYARAGDLSSAEDAALEGISWSERTEERFLAAELRRQLGHVLRRRHGHFEAVGPWRDAVRIAAAQGHRVSELRSLAVLVETERATASERDRLVDLARDPVAWGPQERKCVDHVLRDT